MKELSLKKNILWNTAGSLVYQGCQWLTTIAVVVFSISFENSGILAFAMATGNVFSAFATYNMRTYQVSDVEGRFSSANYVGFRMLTVAMSFVVFSLYSVVLAADEEILVAWLLFLVFKADEAFSTVLYGVDQKFQRMDYVGISQGIRGVASIALFCIGLVVFGSLAVAIALMAAGCIAVTVLYDVRVSCRFEPIRPRLTGMLSMEMAKTCLPAVISCALNALAVAIVRQYYGLAYGSENLGVYAAIATPCVVVQVLFVFLYTPFLSNIARACVEDDKTALKSLVGKLFLMLGAVTVACLLTAVFVGESLVVALFGQSVEACSWMVVPAMFAATFMALSCLCVDLLIVARRLRMAVVCNAVAAGACAALCIPFCAWWGMNGVNITVITAFATSVVVGVIALSREKGFCK